MAEFVRGRKIQLHVHVRHPQQFVDPTDGVLRHIGVFEFIPSELHAVTIHTPFAHGLATGSAQVLDSLLFETFRKGLG